MSSLNRRTDCEKSFVWCSFRGFHESPAFADKNKEFYYIVTCADDAKASQETTIACFRGFADCVEGAIEKAIINDAGWHRQFPRFLLRTRPPKPSLCHWSRQQATVIAPRERRLFPVCFRRRGTVFFHALQKTGFSYSLNCCKKTRYGAPQQFISEPGCCSERAAFISLKVMVLLPSL